jgi:hypothetical protein
VDKYYQLFEGTCCLHLQGTKKPAQQELPFLQRREKEDRTPRATIRCREDGSYLSKPRKRLTYETFQDGRQRLSRAQRLQNQLTDYFLTPAAAIPSQWSYIN